MLGKAAGARSAAHQLLKTQHTRNKHGAGRRHLQLELLVRVPVPLVGLLAQEQPGTCTTPNKDATVPSRKPCNLEQRQHHHLQHVRAP